ncbi:MAG TPA: hypothetical protein VGL99_27635 [Chloroflexota bacterium]
MAHTAEPMAAVVGRLTLARIIAGRLRVVRPVLAAASAWCVSWRAVIDRADPAVTWLLASDEPAVQALTLTGVLGLPADDPEVRAARERFSEGPIARQLLSYAGEHVYAKWRGPFWRLTSLVELGVPSGRPEACEYLRMVLEWLRHIEARGYPPRIAGMPRAHALWYGHALAAAVALEWRDVDDTKWLIERLLEWQWRDGGWNCDRHPSPSCSSVHETLGPLWGLAAYHRANGDAAAEHAAQHAAEFFFERRLFRSRRNGEVINPTWLEFRSPANYHYNVLQALWVLAGAGLLPDSRAADAVSLVRSARSTDGKWDANGRWWRPGRSGPYREAADWGPSRPNMLVTLKALTVLRAVDA